MAGTTYSKFFWADYMSDKELLMCSLASQAVWMRMLCVAADAGRGNVLIAGKQPTPDQLALLCGLGVTGAQVEAAIQELERWEVFSRRTDGTIYSRRMERDEKKRRQSSEAGKSSAAVRSGNNKGNFGRSNDIAQRTASTTINHQPESINHQPSTIPQLPPPVQGGKGSGNVVSIEERYSEAEALCRAMGVSLGDDIRRQNWPAKLLTLKQEGITFQALLEAARVKREAGLIPVDVYSPVFLKQDALAIMRRWERESANKPKIPTANTMTRDEWIKYTRMFLRTGFWNQAWGPRPIEDGFLGDDDIADKASTKWEAQGNAPEIIYVGNHEEPYFDVYNDPLRKRDLPSECPHPITVTRSHRKHG